MRFEFETQKDRNVKRKHGISLNEATQIFDQAYIVDRKSDDPEQFRAIGWCGGRLCSVILKYEVMPTANFTVSSQPGSLPRKK
jgi:uncharacterized DUF497 family protein